MALRPYAAAKRTLSFADKLLEVNWGLVLLIMHDRLCRHRHALFGGERAFPALGAASQMGHFTLGLIVLLAAAMIDIRVWMSLAYPGLWLCPAAADRGGCGGACGPGRPALDFDRTAGTAAVGADEDRAGAGAGPLPSRQEHRGSLQARAAGHRTWR